MLSLWRTRGVGLTRTLRLVSTLPDRDVSMQGVQGDMDSDPRFQTWLSNCQRWGLGDCEEKAKDVRLGKKTVEDLFKEQEETLKSIAQTSDLKLIDMGLVSPQGIQGEDCERYQLWLRNCQQFGFGDCAEQLSAVRDGRKTLTQIFAEQDDIIREAAERYRKQNTVQLSRKDMLKRAVKDYGATVIVFHVAISLASLGGFYTLVSSGVDVVAILRFIHVGEAFIESKLAAGASTFVIAYAVHKVFAPARIAMTLTCVPFIVRYLRRVGFLKKPRA